jgi:hypothetical protein
MSEQPIHRPIGAEMERLRATGAGKPPPEAGPAISRFFDYCNELRFANCIEATASIVSQMKAAGYLQGDFQVKIAGGPNVSRISDFHTRATANPALNEGWWFEGQKICSGTREEYEARRDSITA